MNSTPQFIFGTAWKEEATEALTQQALEVGFHAIDTANQRKHYYEEGVGKAIRKFIEAGKKTRDQLFIQTKFTFARGQDHRIPYLESASYKDQVRQSFESSLQHLQTDYLDSLILHGPFSGYGLSPEDWEAWKEMEALKSLGRVKMIGVSNFDGRQLNELFQSARIKPSFVQNRCFAATAWDRDVRNYCREKKIHYQAFSILTANQREIMHPSIQMLAQKYRKSAPQIIFRFSQQIGMIPITGSTSLQHLKEDLNISDFELSSDEILKIETIAAA